MDKQPYFLNRSIWLQISYKEQVKLAKKQQGNQSPILVKKYIIYQLKLRRKLFRLKLYLLYQGELRGNKTDLTEDRGTKVVTCIKPVYLICYQIVNYTFLIGTLTLYHLKTLVNFWNKDRYFKMMP